MSGASSHLLTALLSRSDAEAEGAWRAWRGAVDMQDLSWEEIQFLPLLNGERWNEWLAGDAASGLLKGIVRRAWSESELRLAWAQEAAACLEAVGFGPVTLFGPVSQYVRGRSGGSIRWVSEIRLLVPRPDTAAAAEVLRSKGWELYGEPPTDLDYSSHMSFTRDGVGLYLHWRVLSVWAEQVEDCERLFLEGSEMLESWRVLTPGCELLDALKPREHTGSADVIPWQADAARVPREGMDWSAWKAMAEGLYPAALERLAELRALGVDVPLLQPTVASVPVQRRASFLGRNVRRAIRVLGLKERA